MPDKIDLKEMVAEAVDQQILLEGGAAGHMMHLYEDGKMTFGEMRNVLQDVFQGKTTLSEKVDGLNLMVTYKDGKFGFARNRATLKEPMDIDRLSSKFDGNPKLKEAFTASAQALAKALRTIS